MVYEKPPPNLPNYVARSSCLQALDSELTNREHILQLLKKKLLKAQETMKLYVDQRRFQHPFKVGDLVFVKLRPYRQVFMGGKRVQKLSKRFYGPFKIVKQIGAVAFELELPDTCKIHLVFHASQLKPCYGSTTPTLDLPPDALFNQPKVQPLAILDWEGDLSSLDGRVLVQWTGL